MTRRKAFTIIEMLLATSLAAVMMIGVLHVVGSIRPQLTAGQKPASAPWSAKMIALLRWDLTNARTIRQENNKLTLVGYSALDRSDFGWQRGSQTIAAHEPVVVVYHLWLEAGRSWLLRRQTHTTEHTNRNTWSETIASHVESFQLQAVSDSGDLANDPTGQWFQEPGPVPARVRLVVRTDDDHVIDTVIGLR